LNIAKHTVVEVDYTLRDSEGEVLDQSGPGEPLAYLHGSKNIIPGLEKELEGRKAGDSLRVEVKARDAYGDRNDDLVSEVPRSDLSSIPDLEVGMRLQAQSSEGVRVVTVTDVSDETVVLDANHPLAGIDLHFEVKVLSVRKASDVEIAHGHVHGPGGHHH
jgi:FKBP-type peptidyl-prolyl cis-trans isomerase SlyD